MSLSVNEAPIGFQPVNSGELYYIFTESSVVGKVNYRVEIEFNGFFSGVKFKFSPDEFNVIRCNIAPMLRAALDMQTANSPNSRLKQTFVRYQAVWDASSDAQVSIMIPIYFYLASNNSLNYRSKLFVDNSIPSSNKFLIPTSKLAAINGRTSYVDWLQSVGYPITYNVSAFMTVDDQGTFRKNTGAPFAWGTGTVYSTENYTQSCRLSFVPSIVYKAGTGGNSYIIGINETPAVDGSFNTIDYGIMIYTKSVYIYAPTPMAAIYENGVVSVLDIPYTEGVTKFSIVYDGVNVRYFKDGILLRTVARAVGNPLYLDSAFYSADTQVTQVEFGPLAKWVSSANIVLENFRQFYKSAGGNAWNEQVYSVESYTTNVYCKASLRASTSYAASLGVAWGLTSDPAVGADYTTIDYCWYFGTDGKYLIYENGAIRFTSIENLLPSDIFSIVYDGTNVYFYRNLEMVFLINRAVGAALYFDSSLYISGSSGLTNVEFGPLPTLNYLNYNNGADINIAPQVFKGEKMTLESVAYTAFDKDGGTITVKQVGTNTVFATILNELRVASCDNPIHLRWLNDLGGLSTWMFDFNQLLRIGVARSSRKKMLTIYTSNITMEQWMMLQELNKDGDEYNYIYKAGNFVQDITTIASPLPVVVEEKSSSVETKSVLYYVQFNIYYNPINYNS